MKNKKSGFTLAEVLVTLGIIGVISAMTVPSLMQNYQRKSYVTQLNKVYNLLSQALMSYQNDKNAIDLAEAGLTSAAEVKNFLNKYLKVSATCYTAFTPCFASTYKNMNGTTLNNGSYWAGTANAPCVSLVSGAAICMEQAKYHSTKWGDVTSPYGHITIDINGQQGPNIAGRDLFFVTYYLDGSIDEDGVPPACKTQGQCGSSKTNPQDARAALGCAARSDAKGCFGLILNADWEMDY